MSVITYEGFKTKCKIIKNTIFEVDCDNRTPYKANPDILYEFIKIKNKSDLLNFCNEYGFLTFEAYPGKSYVHEINKRGEKTYEEETLVIQIIRDNLRRLISLWNSYNSADTDSNKKLDILSEIQETINKKTKDKLVTDIWFNYPKSIEDDNGLFLNKTSPLILNIQCLTLEAYLYFMFYEITVNGNVIRTCPACDRDFETSINSNKIMCNLPGCDGIKKRNNETVKYLRQNDKSIALMSNRIHTQLNDRLMKTLPDDIYKKYKQEASGLIERWKELQEQYRNGEIEYHYLKEITLKELTEFRDKVKKGGK